MPVKALYKVHLHILLDKMSYKYVTFVPQKQLFFFPLIYNSWQQCIILN